MFPEIDWPVFTPGEVFICGPDPSLTARLPIAHAGRVGDVITYEIHIVFWADVEPGRRLAQANAVFDGRSYTKEHF